MSKEQKEQILKDIMAQDAEKQDFISGVAVGIMRESARREQEKKNAEEQK